MIRGNNIQKKKAGRIGYYKDDFLRQVYQLAKLGARDQDIADFFNVNVTTIDYWKKNKPDFMQAMKEGKTIFDIEIVETLGRRALGYEYTETEISQHVDKFGNIRDLKKVSHKKMAPDVTAIIFWLKNRQRQFWADVNKTEISATVNLNETQTLNIESKLTETEKELIRSIAIKKISALHGVSHN